MNKPRRRTAPRHAESGYALLMVVAIAALMTIAASTIALRVATQGQRVREEELEWRGKQYIRGVRLFYRKNRRFPTSMDELVKNGIGVRYMRKAYKDPVNKEDGSWRLLYVGPAGQLLGSVRKGGINIMGGAARIAAQPVLPGATPAGALPGATDPTATHRGVDRRLPGGLSPAGAQAETLSHGLAASPGPLDPTGLTPATGLSKDGKIIGGSIVGVASKIDKKSVKVYDGAETYREWEFFYDMSKDVAMVAPPGARAGAPAGRNTPEETSPFKRRHQPRTP